MTVVPQRNTPVLGRNGVASDRYMEFFEALGTLSGTENDLQEQIDLINITLATKDKLPSYYIPTTESRTVPEDLQHLVQGPMEIDGEFIIDGESVIL